MPSSPTMSHRRRRSSNNSISLPKNNASQTSLTGHRGHSRTSSMTSVGSNKQRRASSILERSGEFGFANEFADGAGNGLGSLADELAEEEWDEGSDVEEEYGQDDGVHDSPEEDNTIRANAAALPGSPPPTASPARSNTTASPSKARARHRRIASTDSGFSETGDIEDIEKSLDQHMAQLEKLARFGTGNSLDENGSVFDRVEVQLRDLSSQANVETNISRLSNTSNTVSTHLADSYRLFQTLTQYIISPLAAPPDPQTAQELEPLMDALLTSLPRPSIDSVQSIHLLYSSATDLASTLSTVADTVHMNRQNTNTATRKLRAIRETVGVLRREIDEAEEGQKWLERGDWDKKLREREAASVCRDVVGGFEAVCNGWRKRLIGSDGSADVEVTAG